MHYRGWKSTKLHLALIAMGLVTGVYAFAGFPGDQFPTYCMTLTAAAGIYSGASVLAGKKPPPV
jgi:ABC-type transporter Mla subunit MlaD